MRLVIVFIGMASLLVLSCQKEIDPAMIGEDAEPVTDPVSGDLLVKILTHTGTDSSATSLTYDGSRRLIGKTISGISDGFDLSDNFQIVRNASGVITKLIEKSPTISQNDYDSVLTNVFYDATTAKYTHISEGHVAGGLIIKDSIVFVYDASGKGIPQDDYLADFFGGPQYNGLQKVEYDYDAHGNSTGINVFEYKDTSHSFLLEGITTYTYDAKVNPLLLNAGEAMVLQEPDLSSPSNITGVNLNNLTDPSTNVQVSIVYTYNSANKPRSAIQTRNPGNIVTHVDFYYQ
jgi:YD repeat-containing protein